MPVCSIVNYRACLIHFVYLLFITRYCSHNECTNLLHELILAVGYFCVLNHDNQVPFRSDS